MDVNDGLMAAHVANKVLLILQQLETYQSSTERLDKESRQRLGRLILKAMSLNLESGEQLFVHEFVHNLPFLDTDEDKCILQSWSAIWKKAASVVDWARTVVSSRMAEIEMKLVSVLYRGTETKMIKTLFSQAQPHVFHKQFVRNKHSSSQ
ncbi:hypothetical protein P879_02966 [Paragonimus westermani]|uniref:Uncharacterized protein n=1 Tax=Paragonimus westermani TaxID=34504 RepID=A0A8T0DCT1_9TREM|nr:hypothetical protein P879_02966 [Paragonimus westermani]